MSIILGWSEIFTLSLTLLVWLRRMNLMMSHVYLPVIQRNASAWELLRNSAENYYSAKGNLYSLEFSALNWKKKTTSLCHKRCNTWNANFTHATTIRLNNNIFRSSRVCNYYDDQNETASCNTMFVSMIWLYAKMWNFVWIIIGRLSRLWSNFICGRVEETIFTSSISAMVLLCS